MNKVQMVGRFTSEPQIKGNGDEFLKSSIAINKKIKGESKTQFVPLTFFGGQAELVDSYFHKGDVIGVSGEFNSSEWFDGDGNKRNSVSIVVTEIFFIPTNR